MIERPKKINIPQPKDTKRFKVILLGDAGVGKTQILNQFCHKKFDVKYNSTIAIDYQVKLMNIDQKQIQFNFWDFSGHPEFFEVRNEFYRDADAVLLVMDISLKESMHGLDMWIREAHENGIDESCIVYVVGNKKDKYRAVSEQDGYNWALQRKYPYYETSAQDNQGFDQLFKDLGARIISTQQ